MRLLETDTLWLIPVFPLLGAIVVGLYALFSAEKKREPNRAFVSAVAVTAPALSFLAVAFFYLKLKDPSLSALSETLYAWILTDDFYPFEFALYFDPLACLYLAFVTFVGFWIHLYSVGYMRKDKGYARYMALLNFFLFSMILLVLAKNLLVAFIGWEGVGVCSYLLIAFWYDDDQKAFAGRKAFLVNRIGDIGFVLGAALLLCAFGGSLDYTNLMAFCASGENAGSPNAGLVTAAGLLFFFAACGKSAQLPLYVWLPDAMAGPTPVSALIHAATMVTAGVYLVSRLGFIYLLSPTAMTVVAGVGAITALFAALIAFLQYDIKKILAYSTISQIGFMFLGVGAGALSAGVFHVVTHAFFKACLFLCAGAVITALHHEQDIRKMGGLAKKIPAVSISFIAAWLAILGIPPFASFFSKDEILYSALESDALLPGWSSFLWTVAFIASACTAYYMTRLWVLVFLGKPRDEALYRHADENIPKTMTVPIIVLAIGSTLVGFFGLPEIFGGSVAGDWLSRTWKSFGAAGEELPVQENAWVSIRLMAATLLVAVLGAAVAFHLHSKTFSPWPWIARLFLPIRLLFQNQFYVDAIYETFLLKPLRLISEHLVDGVLEKVVIQGTVKGFAGFFYNFGAKLKSVQTGQVLHYARWIFIGVLLTILFVWMGMNR